MIISGGQRPRPKVCCSQTLVSRDSSKNSSFALDVETELWEAHKCNKPGQLRKGCRVYKKRIAEKGNDPKGES